MMTKPVFQKESEFTHELKERVRQMINADLHGRWATSYEWLKAILLMLISLYFYLSIVFGQHDFWTRVLLVLGFSFTTLILGLNVMHEAAHGNYSRSGWINRALAMTFDLFGISSDLYVIKHTQFHHNYTNVFGMDGDITEAPLIRMSKNQPWMKIHLFQVWYTPFLYSLITISWPIFDLVRLITAKVGDHSFRRPSVGVTLKILTLKAISFFLTYWLPVHQFGFKQGLFFILLFHLSLGVILTLIFQVAHVHDDTRFDQATIDTDWFVHQIKTSADFSTDNRVANFLCGGLNFQAIHHLFPNVSYRHYPAIQKIVRELCSKHGLRYVEFSTFSQAVHAHFTWLERLAQP